MSALKIFRGKILGTQELDFIWEKKIRHDELPQATQRVPVVKEWRLGSRHEWMSAHCGGTCNQLRLSVCLSACLSPLPPLLLPSPSPFLFPLSFIPFPLSPFLFLIFPFPLHPLFLIFSSLPPFSSFHPSSTALLADTKGLCQHPLSPLKAAVLTLRAFAD